jgi:peroxiredoxin
LGPRPPLESLGPLRWRPGPAVPWTLFNVDGKPVSLYDYAGRPVVVIFYLGYGCLHCAEQFKTFAPLAAEFNQAGIGLVAISTDTEGDLKKAVEAFRGSDRPKSQVSSATDTAETDVPDASAPSPATAASVDFPFTLVSNADLRAFKAYHCFDDFEHKPLHGTFLIDREGLIRWQDVGADPFNDAAFLLKEARRLLALPGQF